MNTQFIIIKSKHFVKNFKKIILPSAWKYNKLTSSYKFKFYEHSRFHEKIIRKAINKHIEKYLLKGEHLKALQIIGSLETNLYKLWRSMNNADICMKINNTMNFDGSLYGSTINVDDIMSKLHYILGKWACTYRVRWLYEVAINVNNGNIVTNGRGTKNRT